jgi:hypothetical protein
LLRRGFPEALSILTSSKQSRIAINAILARLAKLGFNLAITTFQISNSENQYNDLGRYKCPMAD